MSEARIIQECFLVLGRFVKPGDTITYYKEIDCSCCGQSVGKAPFTGIIETIFYYPGTGFCEMGDTIKIRFTNGDFVSGDSENGFSHVS